MTTKHGYWNCMGNKKLIACFPKMSGCKMLALGFDRLDSSFCSLSGFLLLEFISRFVARLLRAETCLTNRIRLTPEHCGQRSRKIAGGILMSGLHVHLRCRTCSSGPVHNVQPSSGSDTLTASLMETFIKSWKPPESNLPYKLYLASSVWLKGRLLLCSFSLEPWFVNSWRPRPDMSAYVCSLGYGEDALT